MKKYLVPSLAAIVLAFIPHVVEAQQLWIYCGGLPSCGPGFDEHFSNALNLLLRRFPNYVYMLGVLFIMIGGVYMVISAGDAEKVTKGKNTIIWAVIGIFVMQFADTVVNFIIIPEVNTRNGATDLVASITITLINDILILIYIAILVVAVVSGMRMVLALGKEEEFKKGKDGLFWAAVGAIIINLAQAIANVFCLTYPGECYIA